ncbi:MAG TPA: hypothetical protein VKE42_08900 [Candidatus Cybelea sp.]|nr:hypothetical protein [Candidatus Cybelea sp.]
MRIQLGNLSARSLVHWMPWFGTQGHVPFNYTMRSGAVRPYVSADQMICDDQCKNMLDAGASGINADYYGPDAPSHLATLRMLNSCERTALSFTLCIDKGALKGLQGKAATDEYIRILNFCADTFFLSSWYLESDGAKVVSFFGEPGGVDWRAVRAGVATKLKLLFQSNFSHAECDGSFGWVNPVIAEPENINTAAVESFNAMAAAAPNKLAWHPLYAGFDNSLATWGERRFMTRGCGRTWQTIRSLVPELAQWALVATWNDHEEGSGIEQCAAVM